MLWSNKPLLKLYCDFKNIHNLNARLFFVRFDASYTSEYIYCLFIIRAARSYALLLIIAVTVAMSSQQMDMEKDCFLRLHYSLVCVYRWWEGSRKAPTMRSHNLSKTLVVAYAAKNSFGAVGRLSTRRLIAWKSIYYVIEQALIRWNFNIIPHYQIDFLFEGLRIN